MAKDKFHEAVKKALENDGWKITHDPLILFPKEEKIAIDLGAEKILIAEKGFEKIAVEVKSFTQPSVIYAFHEALGQYMNYLTALEIAEEKRALYLAVSEDVFASFEDNTIIIHSIEKYKVKILIFDIITQNIVKWM